MVSTSVLKRQQLATSAKLDSFVIGMPTVELLIRFRVFRELFPPHPASLFAATVLQASTWPPAEQQRVIPVPWVMNVQMHL